MLTMRQKLRRISALALENGAQALLAACRKYLEVTRPGNEEDSDLIDSAWINVAVIVNGMVSDVKDSN